MKKKLRTTSFWLGVIGAIIIVLESITQVFGVELYSKQVESILLAVCSAMVLLGIITKKNENDNTDSSSEDLLDEINKDEK